MSCCFFNANPPCGGSPFVNVTSNCRSPQLFSPFADAVLTSSALTNTLKATRTASRYCDTTLPLPTVRTSALFASLSLFRTPHHTLDFLSLLLSTTVPHLDYLDIDTSLEHDYDSAGKGGNRFATILLYMTDLEEKDGGETVFTHAWPTGQAEVDNVDVSTVSVHFRNRVLIRFCFCSICFSALCFLQALNILRESDQHGILEQGSWQETMVSARTFSQPY